MAEFDTTEAEFDVMMARAEPAEITNTYRPLHSITPRIPQTGLQQTGTPERFRSGIVALLLVDLCRVGWSDKDLRLLARALGVEPSEYE